MKYQIDRASHRLPSRVVSSHPFYFVAAYVPGRAPGQRRTPDSMSSLVMPFCAERFNFTKIKPCEKLFEMSFTSKNGKVSRASVLVNNSPVEYCSSLLVPSLAECLPQVGVDPSRLCSFYNMLLLSQGPYCRVGEVCHPNGGAQRASIVACWVQLAWCDGLGESSPLAYLLL